MVVKFQTVCADSTVKPKPTNLHGVGMTCVDSAEMETDVAADRRGWRQTSRDCGADVIIMFIKQKGLTTTHIATLWRATAVT